MLVLVLVRKSFRYRVYPSETQIKRLEQWEHALRSLWNLALEQRLWGLARARDERRYYSAFDQINQLTELRAEIPWLAEVPRNVCAQLLVELDKAWQRCFKKLADEPRWKRKGRDIVNFCEPHPKVWHLEGAALHFPKLGMMRVVVHRPLEGKPKTCTIVREGDQWFAAISCEVEIPEPAPRTEPIVALDRGITNLVADSDGNIIINPKHLEQSLRQLRHTQRVVSRRQKGSRNKQKAVVRVSRLHRTVRRQRDHVLHALSAAYAKSHGTVVVERLQIRNMVRNRHLSRRIGAAGWGRLVTFLGYKTAWAGGQTVEEEAAYSSQTCAVCGHVDAASRSGERFYCTKCGVVAHADVNAAKVLKARYLARTRVNRSGFACGGMPPEGARRSRKRLNVARRSSESSALLGRG